MRPTPPYPAEAARDCDPMPEPQDATQDAYLIWAGQMIDLYTECALRHRALGDWVRGQSRNDRGR